MSTTTAPARPTTLVRPEPTRRPPSPPTGHPASPGRRADLLALAAYLLLGLLVAGRYLPDVDGRISARLPDDNVWFQWLLSHGAYSVRHLQNPLFSLRQNAPAGVNMMANTSVLGVTIPLAPLTMLAGPGVAYLVWLAGGCAATAATAYWALSRHLVRSRAAAFVGGAFAGFAPGVVHHANGQPNFVVNFLVPIIVVRVLRLGDTGRWLRDGAVLGLLVTYQLFLNEELLLATAAACGVACLAVAYQRRALARRRAAGFLRALGVTAVVAGALCAYPIWFQFHGPQTYHGLPIFHSWGEDLVTYVSMSRDAVGGTATSEDVVGLIEQNTWFGWPLTATVIILLVVLWRGSAVMRVAGVVGLVFAVAALGPVIRFNGQLTGVPGPWSLVPASVPVLGLLMPCRLSLVVIGVLAVVLAIGWDELARRDLRAVGGRPDATLLSRLVIAAALVPLIPTPVPTMPADPTPQFITSGAWRPYVPPGSTLVPVPLPDNSTGRGALQWSAAAQHEFAVPRGYFLGPDSNGNGHMGPATASFAAQLFATTARTNLVPAITPAIRAAVRDEVRQWHGAAVVLGPNAAEGALHALLDDLFGPGRRNLDVWVWDVRQS